jgi:excisionase family DNA binding protein
MAKLLTVPEVAEMLRVSARTVYRLIDRGRIPTVSIVEGKLLVEACALEAAIRGGQVKEPAVA